ncbi:MAG: ATP-dependent DNA ligase [Candidatus Thorarchaeota archaeon]
MPAAVKSPTTRFHQLAEVSEAIMATNKRLEKMDYAGAFFSKIHSDEREAAALLLIGQTFPRTSQRALDLHWSALYQILQELFHPPQELINELFAKSGDIGEVVYQLYIRSGKIRQTTLLTTPLLILDVLSTFTEIADVQGPGSRKRKTALLRSLFTRATPLEAKYLAKALVSDQRIGFNEGMLESALARTLNLPLNLVRRANMLTGNIGEVTRIAYLMGAEGLEKVKLRPFTPLLPMLAAQAENVEEALATHEYLSAFEMKLDGARVQIHLLHEGGQPRIKVFSRRLTDVTPSLPDIVNLVMQEVQTQSCILEGEVLALDSEGRPFPFQYLMRRFRRLRNVKQMVENIPLTLHLFDLLMVNGEVLIDTPYTIRREKLIEISGAIPLVEQLVSSEISQVETFFDKAIQAGHEGLIAKRLNSPYHPGTRGKAWLKLKKTMETLDLVIIAAEWGTGRRHKWLSDYHLAAQDPEVGEYLMLGKTFKGLTDAEFEDITQRLMKLKIRQVRGVVKVQPQIVVEVEYDEIQRSPTYKSGMALRFARIKRLRYDKNPAEADTIQRVQALFDSQFSRKASTDQVGRSD